MGNAYFLSPEERFAETLTSSIASGDVSKVQMEGEKLRLAALLSKRPSINGMIEVTYDNEIVNVSFHANALRGLAQSFTIPRATATGLSIRFQEKLTGKSIILRGPNLLGANGMYTPWKFQPSYLPKGIYKIDLIIQDFHVLKTKISEPKKINFLDSFVAN